MRPRHLTFVVISIMGLSAGSTAWAQKPTMAAQLFGENITLAELETAAKSDLIQLEVQRYRILQSQLDRLVAARVLSLEAKARGLTETELVQQDVFAKIQEPSLEEIQSYYQASKDLMKEPQEKAVPRIRQALTDQRRQKQYADYVERLKVKYQFKSLLEPVRMVVEASDSPARGSAAAPVTITEFSDFECPYCLTLSKTLSSLGTRYGDDVRLVFRHFPLDRLHPNAMRAAEVSVCAGEQGRFWELHDRLFAGGRLSEEEILKRAADAGVNTDDLQACLASGKAAERVRADVKAGQALGVASTPSFFINGRPMRGAVAIQDIVRVIDEELKTAGKVKSSPAAVR